MDAVDYMRLAIAAAKQSVAPFGSVLVNRSTGDVLATGYNRSPIRHAELDALLNCPESRWPEVDLYTTAEPCPLCQGAIEFARIRIVHYGSSIPYLQAHGWWQIDIRAAVVASRCEPCGAQLVGGVCEDECNALYEDQ